MNGIILHNSPETVELLLWNVGWSMPRLANSAEPPQHGSRHDKSAKRKKPAAPAEPPAKEKKQRVFLNKDQQALLMLGYYNLPKRKQGSQERGLAMKALCEKYNVTTNYPLKMIASLKANEVLPSRDGVGGAPERITGEAQASNRGEAAAATCRRVAH